MKITGKVIQFDRRLLITGIPLIDRQHAEYANLVESLFAQAMRGGVSRRELSGAMDAVLKYAMEHFDAEELVMLEHQYPAYAEHRAKHNIFRDRTDSLSAGMKDLTDMDTFTVQMSRWLIEWFCDQVQTDDRKLAAFLKRRPT